VLDLDVALDLGQTVADAISAVIGPEADEVQATVLERSGPGGGWPLVRFEGPADALARLEARYDGETP
jgi:hypothetical protein